MYIQLSKLLLEFLLKDAAELGSLQALARTGRIKPNLNKSQAFRLYGRKNVEYWIENRLITPIKDGDQSACWRIDRIEAHAIFKAMELLRYF